MDGFAGGCVEHGAANGGGQSAGGNRPAGDGVDQLLFRALGVLGRQHVHDHAVGGGQMGFQRLYRLGLVVLNADVAFLQTENPHQNFQTGDHFLRHLPAQPVVGGYVGLTLTGVDDNGIHLAQAAGDFGVGGEGSAAHANHAALPDDIDELLVGKRVYRFLSPALNVRAQGVLVVVFDDHAHDGGAAGVGTGLYRLHLTGNGSVNGNTQALIVTDLLTHGDQIPFFDQGLAGGADMLGHGNDNHIRGGEGLNLLVASVPLIFFGMDPSEKRKRHITSPLSNFAEKTAGLQI